MTTQETTRINSSLSKGKMARAYTARPGEKKVYGGSKPLFPKCNYYYDGQYAPKCANYKRTGHLAQDCRSPATNAKKPRALGEKSKVSTMLYVEVQAISNGIFPKLKNNNRENQSGNGGATTRAYAKKYHAVIFYDEKIVRIPFGNEILIARGDGTRAPYRLAPPEMKELSDQLQELFNKGFIIPSSLTLVGPVLLSKDGWMYPDVH
ncbi:hypothetical protein Tco_0757728 [Tanacetum coccineum]